MFARMAGLCGAGVALFCLVAAGPALAQSTSPARLSLVTGAVEVQLPHSSTWQPAMSGAPLEAGSSLRTLDSGRAEFLLPGGSALRLIPGTQLLWSGLDNSDHNHAVAATLLSGTVFVTWRQPGSDFNLAFGPHALGLRQGSSARVDAGKISVVTVLDGKANLLAGKHTTRLESGQQAALRGSNLSLTSSSLNLPPDPWTEWSKNRDASLAAGLHNGVEPASLADYVNWYGQVGTQPSFAQGTGLTYAGTATCPWTVVNGDYQGWCWSEPQGWFLPVQPINPAPQSSASVNEAAMMSQNASWAGMGGWGSADAFFGPPCFIVNGLVEPFCLSDPFNPFFGFDGLGGSPLIVYEFVPVLPVGSGVRNARLGLPNPRQLGRHFDPVAKPRPTEAGLRRLAPPPRAPLSSGTAEIGFRTASRAGWTQEGVRASHTRIGRNVAATARNSAVTNFRSGGSSVASFSSASLGVRGAMGGAASLGMRSSGVSSGARAGSIGRTPH